MLFTERHLQMVWGLQLFRRGGLLTEDARPLLVEFPGLPSVEGGPDFRGARLVLGGVPVTGDVELHLTTAGWEGHGHGGDPSYDAVVLHVALRRDRFHRGARGFAGRSIPELVLEPALEKSESELLDEITAARGASPPVGNGVLEAWGDRRFDRRVERLRLLAARTPAADLFVREVFVGLGYKQNKAPFEELARLVPPAALRGLGAAGIETRLAAAAAGLAWRTRGVRPANQPRRRLSGAARWLAAVGVDAPHEAHFASPRPGLFDPGGAGLIGPDRAAALVANVVLPMMALREPGRAREIFLAIPAPAGNRKSADGAALLGVQEIGTLRREWGLLEFLRRFP